jgi:phosphoribosyl-ATP pyrophosphohydrolase/phosphoribosyl-AMP cyclohydrolase
MTPDFDKTIDVAAVDWAKGGGLVAAIVQDAGSGRVLMLGYMNEDALRLTQDTGRVTFFSRSKNRLWVKGETSGHYLRLRGLALDCDGDAILVRADPDGPTCHRGTRTCFAADAGPALAPVADLAATIRARRHNPTADSYTARLFAAGIPRIAQKVGEEAVETALAAATASDTLAGEAADLIYHMLVLLEARDVPLSAVTDILAQRSAAPRAAAASHA